MFSLRISLAVLTFLAAMIIVRCDDKCENGGTVKKGVSTVCQCPYGFKGFNCSKRVLPCEGRPCQNNGKCKELQNKTFKCLCSSLFTGVLCHKRVLPCNSGPCKNGGTCINKGGTCFKCECGFGFKGSDCSKIVKPCELRPCKNGGICRNKNGNYQCTCKKGFGGINCEIKDALYESVILKKKIAWISLLEKWIGSHEKNWRLCYNALQHGWRAADFHQRCDNKKPILSIVRVGHYIFGGYSDISFGGNTGYKGSTKSFIFSIKNKDNLPPFKSSVKYKNSKYAIYTNPSYGITFGGGHDYFIKDNAHTTEGSYSNFGHTYALPSGYTYSSIGAKHLLAGSYKFIPNEIEVFYLE